MPFNPDKFFVITGAVMGALAVAIGAFGAHALKALLTATNRLDTFETASRYHFYHVFALLLVAVVANFGNTRWLNISGHLFIWGTVIFSGTLYLLCLTGKTWLGAITPIGGVLLILGWCALAYGIARA